MARITGEEVDLDLHITPEDNSLPRVPPGSPWLYKHHPKRWDVIGGKVRPALAKLKVIPGVNEVTSKGDPGPAIMKAQKAGWTILDKAACKTSYLRKHEVKGGFTYQDMWTELFPGTPRTDTDFDGYVDFLDSIVKTGVVPPPTIIVLGDLVDKYQGLAERNRKVGTPGADRRADTFEERLAVAKAALAALKKSKSAASRKRSSAKAKNDAAAEAKRNEALKGEVVDV